MLKRLWSSFIRFLSSGTNVPTMIITVLFGVGAFIQGLIWIFGGIAEFGSDPFYSIANISIGVIFCGFFGFALFSIGKEIYADFKEEEGFPKD